MSSHRWYQNPNLDVSQVPAVAFNADTAEPLHGVPAKQLAPTFFSNPLDRNHKSATPSPDTKTLSAREVHFGAQSRVRALTANTQPREQLDALLERLDEIQ